MTQFHITFDTHILLAHSRCVCLRISLSGDLLFNCHFHRTGRMYDHCFVSRNMMRYCIVFITNFNYAPLVSRIIVRENRVAIARFSKLHHAWTSPPRRSFAKRNKIRFVP